jgi:hypothetical protein
MWKEKRKKGEKEIIDGGVQDIVIQDQIGHFRS